MKVDRALFYGAGDPITSIKRLLENFSFILSGNVSFGATNTDLSRNIDCWMVLGAAAAGVANTDFSVNHNLKRVPVGYIIIGKSGIGDVYTGAGTWTAATNAAQGSIFLRCTTTGITLNLIVI